MPTTLRVVLVAIGLFFVATASSLATESLYNRETAKAPTSPLARLLGPKASGVRYDSRMLRAAEIASSRAHAHSQSRCWSYVKGALVSAKVVESRPTTAYAKEAAWELTNKYGFQKIRVSDPYKAPIGSVLVYGGRGAGHVEIRTNKGFVSDFSSPRPSKRPLIGVYIKPKT